MNIVILSCGSYASQGYGCPGEWKCLQAAARKEGYFSDYGEDVKVVGFLTCNCPGRPVIANLKCIKNNVDFDAVHFSSCMIKGWPECPYKDLDELAGKIEEALGVKVVKGTHQYG